MDHVLDPAAERLRLGDAGDRGRGRVPEPDHAVTVDEDDAVAHRLEGARSPAAPLRFGVQQRVVDRRGRVPGELLGEGCVLLAVDAAGLGRHEGDRAEHLAACGERHGHVGPRCERACDLELGLAEAEGCELALADRLHEHRLGRPRRDGDRREHRLLELAGERELDRVCVLEGEPLQLPVDEDVDRAPVRDARHCEPGDVRQGLLVVERAAEHPAGLGEERLPLLGQHAVLDVGRGADPAEHVPRLVSLADRAAEMPAIGAVGPQQPVDDLERLAGRLRPGPLLVHPGHVLGVHDRPRVPDLAGRHPRVVVPALVVEDGLSVCIRRPDDLRHRVGERAVPHFALALGRGQLLLGEERVAPPDLDRLLPELDEDEDLRPQHERVERLHQVVDGARSCSRGRCARRPSRSPSGRGSARVASAPAA